MIPEAYRVGGARLGYVLLFAMGFATLTGGVLGILGPFLLDDLNITRAGLGWLITVNTISGAIVSFWIGRFTDRIGGYGAFGLLCISASIALALYASARSALLIALGAVFGGISQALSNPSTNKIIALHVVEGRRGVVTGVKQSGVYLMLTIAGISVPAGALGIGWRPTVAIFAGAALAFLATGLFILPDDRKLLPSALSHSHVRRPVNPAVWWLTAYGFLHGLVGGFSFLFPLYATEALGRSEQFAGFVVAVAAIGALVGRIVWARLAEVRLGYSTPLLLMALAAMMAGLLLLAAQSSAVWLAVVGAVLFGASTNSWNSVGMLAVTNISGSADAGRGTGIVLTGFLAGLGVGPPVLGWLLDRYESYTLVWAIVIGVFALSVPLVLAWRSAEKREIARVV